MSYDPPSEGSPEFWGERGRQLHSFPSAELRDAWLRESEFNISLDHKAAGGKRFGGELWEATRIVYHRPIIAPDAISA